MAVGGVWAFVVGILVDPYSIPIVVLVKLEAVPRLPIRHSLIHILYFLLYLSFTNSLGPLGLFHCLSAVLWAMSNLFWLATSFLLGQRGFGVGFQNNLIGLTFYEDISATHFV